MTGENKNVRAAIDLAEGRIKGERPLALKERRGLTCIAPPPAFTSGAGAPGERPEADTETVAKARWQCIYSGTHEADLLEWYQKR